MERLEEEYLQFTEDYKRVQKAFSAIEQGLQPGERNLKKILEQYWAEKGTPRRKLQIIDRL